MAVGLLERGGTTVDDGSVSLSLAGGGDVAGEWGTYANVVGVAATVDGRVGFATEACS